MFRMKGCLYLVASAVICCVLQYYLLVGSHKRGAMSWPYVFSISLSTFFIANQLYKNFCENMVLVVIILTVMTFIPFSVYILKEWVCFPAAVLNTIKSVNIFFHFWIITLFSGGWIFSIALVLNARYRRKLGEI